MCNKIIRVAHSGVIHKRQTALIEVPAVGDTRQKSFVFDHELLRLKKEHTCSIIF